MERYKRERDIVKTVNILTSKHKSFFLHINIVYTYTYSGYRVSLREVGDKEFNEILFNLTFNRKIERLSISFGIMDDRSLPF